MKKENEKFCTECGEVISKNAEICPKCGVRQPMLENSEKQESQNRWIISMILCWFLGVFGVHRFYTGHTTIGIVQLLTLGGCGIWALVDFIMLVVGSYKDANGIPVKGN
jgi:TM2 domain-containing membrane protein YozV